ncbi:MAG: hypothetical protein IJF08_09510 [Clostridia bacterium]|nr:hypothetical protein [Clostridia bacterium]
MPIGKQSINRVAKKADTEEIKPVAAEQPAKAKKPSTAKKSTSGATRTKTVKLTPPEVDPKQESPVVTEPEIPAVTEHVIANIDPEVVEKVVGKETPAPKDGKVKLTDPMPSYLL